MSRFEILKDQVDKWTLDSDLQMLKMIEDLSNEICDSFQEIGNRIYEINRSSSEMEVKLVNSFNNFTMLSNKKFIENKIRTEDIFKEAETSKIEEPTPQPTSTGYTQNTAELYKKYQSALDNVLGALKLQDLVPEDNATNYDTLTDDLSSVAHTGSGLAFRGKLPFIIGSHQFEHDPYIGIDAGQKKEAGLTVAELEKLKNEDGKDSVEDKIRSPSELEAPTLGGPVPPLPPRVQTMAPNNNEPPPENYVLPQSQTMPLPPPPPPPPPMPASMKVSANKVQQIVASDVSALPFSSNKNDFNSSLKEILKDKRDILDGVKDGSLSIKEVQKREDEIYGRRKTEQPKMATKEPALRQMPTDLPPSKQPPIQPMPQTQNQPPQLPTLQPPTEPVVEQPKKAKGKGKKKATSKNDKNTKKNTKKKEPPPKNAPAQAPPQRAQTTMEQNRSSLGDKYAKSAAQANQGLFGQLVLDSGPKKNLFTIDDDEDDDEEVLPQYRQPTRKAEKAKAPQNNPTTGEPMTRTESLFFAEDNDDDFDKLAQSSKKTDIKSKLKNIFEKDDEDDDQFSKGKNIVRAWKEEKKAPVQEPPKYSQTIQAPKKTIFDDDDDEEDGGLFGGKAKAPPKQPMPKNPLIDNPLMSSNPPAKKSALFDDDDDDETPSRMPFNKVEPPKEAPKAASPKNPMQNNPKYQALPIVLPPKKEPPKTSKLFDDDDDDEPPKKVSAPPIIPTHPPESGIKEEPKSVQPPPKKNLFDDDDDDDIPPKKEPPRKSIFDDDEDQYRSLPPKVEPPKPNPPRSSLFNDDEDDDIDPLGRFSAPKKTEPKYEPPKYEPPKYEPPKYEPPKQNKNLFGDSDDDDTYVPPKKAPTTYDDPLMATKSQTGFVVEQKNTAPYKAPLPFGDSDSDDDYDKGRGYYKQSQPAYKAPPKNDMFGNEPPKNKAVGLFGSSDPPKKKAPTNLFGETPKERGAAARQPSIADNAQASRLKKLFDDDSDSGDDISRFSRPKMAPKKSLPRNKIERTMHLFDDDDD